MKTTIQRLVSMAMWMSTRSGAHRFLHILLFSFLAVCPTVARADCDETGDLRFRVKLNAPASGPEYDLCLFVDGPFYRVSNPVRIRDLTVGQPCTFYAAKDNIFSPWGDWRISTHSTCANVIFNRVNAAIYSIDKLTQCGSTGCITTSSVTIVLDPIGNGKFRFTVYKGSTPSGGTAAGSTSELVESQQSASENMSGQSTSEPHPISVNVSAFLGDSQDPSGKPVTERFHFFGNAGDSVRVRLDADTQRGNNGGHATLRFVGPPAQEVTDALTVEHPQTINVQLGSTRNYDISVEQSGEGEERYRGGYILTVESAQGKHYKLLPFDSVEE